MVGVPGDRRRESKKARVLRRMSENRSRVETAIGNFKLFERSAFLQVAQL